MRAMNRPLYHDEALMWLANHVHERRRELLLSSIGLLVLTVMAVGAGMYVLGWTFGFFGLLLILVAYAVCGGFRAEEPLNRRSDDSAALE